MPYNALPYNNGSKFENPIREKESITMVSFAPTMAYTFGYGKAREMAQELTFSEWLAEQMKRQGYNQTSLATRAGVSPQYIGVLVRNDPHSLTGKPIVPAVEVVDKIAKALGVPQAEARLAAGYAPAKVSEDVEAQIRQSVFADLYEKFMKLPADAKEGIEPFVDLLNREIEKRLASIQNPSRPKPTLRKR